MESDEIPEHLLEQALLLNDEYNSICEELDKAARGCFENVKEGAEKEWNELRYNT